MACQLCRCWARTSARAPVPVEMRVNHPHLSTRLPTQHQLDNMYAHLAHAMKAVDYTDAETIKFLTYLRQLHMRAGIVNWETHIYHMFCRRILKKVGAPRFEGVGGMTDRPDGEDDTL